VEKYGTVRQNTDENITWRMRFACWKTKVANTRPEYVILIAYAMQQQLRESASMLRSMYIVCLGTLKQMARK